MARERFPHSRRGLATRAAAWLDGAFSGAKRPRAAPVLHSISPASSSLDALPARGPVASPENARSLRVCLIGPTNAGKSTLLNQLLGESVSIVSDKIHTTRENTLGYLTDDQAGVQIEFIDAPGSLGPSVPVLRRAIWDAVRAADLAFVVVDAAELSRPGASSARLYRQLGGFLGQLSAELDAQEAEETQTSPVALGGVPAGADTVRDGEVAWAMRGAAAEARRAPEGASVPSLASVTTDAGINGRFGAGIAWHSGAEPLLSEDEGVPAASRWLEHQRHRPLGRRTRTALVLNKVDRVHPKERLLDVSGRLHGMGLAFDWPGFMLSAKTGDGVRDMRRWMCAMARPGEWLVPSGTCHVQPPLTRATEIIRAHIFRCLRQELPYTVQQRNLGWTVLKGGGLRIDQQVLLPPRRPGGAAKASTRAIVESRLPMIGKAAREDLTAAFGIKVSLFLTVGTIGHADELGM